MNDASVSDCKTSEERLLEMRVNGVKKIMFKDQIKYHVAELWAKHKHQVKYVAVATAIGAVVAIPVPGVGPHGGAIIGALAGIALLVKKHAVEIRNPPSPKTDQE